MRKKIVIGIILFIAVVIAAIWFGITYNIAYFVNRELASLPGYYGHVGKIRLHLYKGAYEIDNIVIIKDGGLRDLPLLRLDRLYFTVAWGALFHGRLVSDVVIDRARIGYVVAPEPEKTQTPAGIPWTTMVRRLFPIQINTVKIKNSSVIFKDLKSDPKIDASIQDINGTIDNIANRGNTMARYQASALLMHSGRLSMYGKIDPLAKKYNFDVHTKLTGLDLRTINDFFKAYAKFDVESGTFDLVSVINARDGVLDGYVNPFFRHLTIFNYEKDIKQKKKNGLRAFWEALAGAVAEAFENQPHEQLATKIPIHGTISGPKTDYLTVFAGVLKNAFIRALIPKFTPTPKEEKKKKETNEESSNRK